MVLRATFGSLSAETHAVSENEGNFSPTPNIRFSSKTNRLRSPNFIVVEPLLCYRRMKIPQLFFPAIHPSFKLDYAVDPAEAGAALRLRCQRDFHARQRHECRRGRLVCSAGHSLGSRSG